MKNKVKKIHDPILCRWIQTAIIVFAVIYSVNSLLISYLIATISSDIVYADTVIPISLEYLGELLELAAISFCYSVMICALYKGGKALMTRIFAVFGFATLYKYLLNTVMFWIISGDADLWVFDIINILYYTMLELIQLAVVYMFVRRVTEKYDSEKRFAEKVVMRQGEGAEIKVRKAYPFERIYDRKNCLCRSAYICALAVFIAKLAGEVLSDAWAIISFGPPTDGMTWLYMAVNYISKAIFAACVYFMIYAVISLLLGIAEKRGEKTSC